MKRTTHVLTLMIVSTLTSFTARGAEPEKVVVRNRLYTSEGKLEASANVGFTPVNYLTGHTNLSLGLGYNFTEQLGLELTGGYALSHQTKVAQAVSDAVIKGDPTESNKVVDDFGDLWQMGWNATAAVRWAPVYGKINVAAELPVHFQAFVLGGLGVAGMTRDSLVHCIGKPSQRSQATCVATPPEDDRNALQALHDSAPVKPVILLGGGMRFFLNKHWGLRIEVRDLAFQDSYRVGIERAAAENNADAARDGEKAANQGQKSSSAGLTHLVFAQLGATFSF